MAKKTSKRKFVATKRAEYGDVVIEASFSRKGKALDVVVSQPEADQKSAPAIVAMIDHTLLKADATEEQVLKLCQEAKEHQFAAVCVNTFWAPYCVKALQGSDVKVAVTVGFPLGAMSTKGKVAEAREALRQGVREIDMVLNIGALKSGNLKAVAEDIRKVARVSHRYDGITKVIIETCLLTDEEKVTACLLTKDAGADFVKNSTGFSTGGATVEDVTLMRSVVGPKIGVKASGGVRSYADALRMIEAGATRIGTSSGVKIAEDALKVEG